MESLRERLKELNKADRFKATNAYSHSATPGVPRHGNTGRTQVSTTAPSSAVSPHRNLSYHSRHYVLPSEEPMDVVHAPHFPEDVEYLIWNAIERDEERISNAHNLSQGAPSSASILEDPNDSITTINAKHH
jgi:hypothetical protein